MNVNGDVTGLPALFEDSVLAQLCAPFIDGNDSREAALTRKEACS